MLIERSKKESTIEELGIQDHREMMKAEQVDSRLPVTFTEVLKLQL